MFSKAQQFILFKSAIILFKKGEKLYIVKKGGNKFIFGCEEAFYAGDGACQLVGEGKFLFAMGIFMLYGNGGILFRKRIILIWKKKDFIKKKRDNDIKI